MAQQAYGCKSEGQICLKDCDDDFKTKRMISRFIAVIFQSSTVTWSDNLLNYRLKGFYSQSRSALLIQNTGFLWLYKHIHRHSQSKVALASRQNSGTVPVNLTPCTHLKTLVQRQRKLRGKWEFPHHSREFPFIFPYAGIKRNTIGSDFIYAKST